jgi:hypothetical protein
MTWLACKYISLILLENTFFCQTVSANVGMLYLGSIENKCLWSKCRTLLSKSNIQGTPSPSIPGALLPSPSHGGKSQAQED